MMRATTAPNSWEEYCRTCGGEGFVTDYDKPIKEEKRGMNYSTNIMLVNDNIKAVLVSYERDKDGKGIKPFTMFKTLDHSIQVNDLVVVPTNTRHEHTVVRVEALDVEVDYEDSTFVQWIIDKVDTSAAAKIALEEIKWIDALKAGEKKAKKDEIRKKLLSTFEGDIDISKLAIANVTDVTALEYKPEEEATTV